MDRSLDDYTFVLYLLVFPKRTFTWMIARRVSRNADYDRETKLKQSVGSVECLRRVSFYGGNRRDMMGNSRMFGILSSSFPS